MEDDNFDVQAFKKAFDKAKLNHEGRIKQDDLSELLDQFDLSQPSSSITKNCSRFFMYAHRKNTQNIKENLKEQEVKRMEEQKMRESHSAEPQSQMSIQERRERIKKEVEEASSDEDEPEQEKKDMDYWQQISEYYELNKEEAVMYADLIRNKIKWEIWKKTCDLLTFQFLCNIQTNRKSFPLRDPGQNANIKVVVGEEPPSYDSYIHAKIKKLPFRKEQYPSVRVRLTTNSLQESQKFKQMWQGIYELLKGMLEGELPDGLAFLESIKIVTVEEKDYFELRATSENPTLNEFLFLLTNLPDGVFKTDFKMTLEAFLEFNFDIGKLTSQRATLYDMITKDIRFKAQGKTSEYLTALKQMLTSAGAFEDLSYVGDDGDTLMRILLVSMYAIDVNMKLKNPTFQKAERSSLQEFLGFVGQIQGQLKEMQQETPDVSNMIRNALNNKIEVEIQAYQFLVEGQVHIRSMSSLLNANFEEMNFDEQYSD